MSTKSARPVSLSDKERKEFDHVTLDSIHQWRDVSKLRRLEQYMTQEGFPTTASATAMRIKALSAGVEISDEKRREEVEAEYKASAHELMSWTSKIVSEEQELSLEPTVLSSAVPAIRKGMKIASDAAPPTKAAPISLTEIKADSSVGINVRSGRQYYDKWDKVAEDELQKLDSEDKPSAATASSTGISAVNPENTQRICKAAEGLSPTERRRQAESERHKGNDYFRSHDYRAAVEAFTVATELDPQSSAARANRAAAYLKLHMWSDAETDACVALQLDPHHLKARLRRAQARCELGQMSLAREDALAVLAKVPDEPAMLALVEKADSVVKKSSTRMVIEEVSTKRTTGHANLDSGSGPPSPKEPNSSRVQPGKMDPHASPHAASDVQASASRSPAHTAEKHGTSAIPALPKPAASGATTQVMLGGSGRTVIGPDTPSDCASRPPVGVCAEGGEPSGTDGGSLRRVPIVIDCDSDSDDESVVGSKGGAAAACDRGAGGVATTPASGDHAVSGLTTESGVATEVGSGGGRSEAPDDQGHDTVVVNNRAPPASAAADAVRITITEDDEATAAADDALLAAAAARKGEPAEGKSGSGDRSSVAPEHIEENKPCQATAESAQAVPPVRGTAAANQADPVASAHDRSSAAAPIQSPEVAAEELMQKGRAAFAAGQLRDAKELFTAAIDTWPLMAAAYSNHAAVEARLGNWWQVVEDSSAVLGLANSDLLKFKALCRRAKGRSQLGDHRGSLRDYQDAEQYVPDQERKALQRDINTTTNVVMRAQQELAQAAAKRTAKKAQKQPLRSTAYGKVTVEELDSDDEEEEPDDDPLADAALMVRKLIQNASNKTSDVHARAQEATEEYKKAVADAAAAAKAVQRSSVPSSPRTTHAASHGPAKPKTPTANADPATPLSKQVAPPPKLATPAPTPAEPSPVAKPAMPAACSKASSASGATSSRQTEQNPPSGATDSGAQPQPRALQAASPASAVGTSSTGPAATHSTPTELPAAAPDRPPSGIPSSSGSDSSYVLVDAPATEASAAPEATTTAQTVAHDAKPEHKTAQGATTTPSGPAAVGPGSDSRQQDGDQSKADSMRVKGIDAWKAGDMDRALGLWCQAAQLAPQDYRVHLNISQVLLRVSKHADALAAANTALEALEADPDAPTALVAKAQYRRGVALQELQKLPEALAALEASHEALPTAETFTAIAKLREQVPNASPSPVEAAVPTPPVPASAEADRTPWGATADCGGAPPAQRRDQRASGESDSSYIHVTRTVSSAGGGMPSAPGSSNAGEGAEGSTSAPAGALRPSDESESVDGDTHPDGGDGTGPIPAVVPASGLEVVADSHGDPALRRFRVPIKEPPIVPEGAAADVAPSDEPRVARPEATGGADRAAGRPAASRSSASGSAVISTASQASAVVVGRRPESPQDLAEQALRVGRGQSAGGSVGPSAVEPLPLPPLPTTAHEFLQAIRGLRRSAESAEQAEVAVGAYVRSVPPDDYAKVIKSNLDGRILAEFSAVLKASVAMDKEWCKNCLLGLLGVERSTIVLVMLPPAQKKALADVKAQLALGPEDANALAKIR